MVPSPCQVGQVPCGRPYLSPGMACPSAMQEEVLCQTYWSTGRLCDRSFHCPCLHSQPYLPTPQVI